ncbi:hypothetical protein L7F22_040237 [Adiantum nelumboides]|nr:hypothetical protein [Adiantum nelumboides]
MRVIEVAFVCEHKSLSSLELGDVVPVTSVAVAQKQLLPAVSSENESFWKIVAVSMSDVSTGHEQRKLYSSRAGRQEESRASVTVRENKCCILIPSLKKQQYQMGWYPRVLEHLTLWSVNWARLLPLEYEEWATFLDSEGRVTDSKALRKRIFYGGLGHQLRREVWKLFLGYHHYDSTYAEQEELRTKKYKEYKLLKAQWQTISAQQAKRFAKFRERKSRVEKDMVRTDRFLPFYAGDDNQIVSMLYDILVTYSFYNFDLGYCQGMSDFFSPILFVMEDESESFWCFVALMEHLAPNFNRDQNAMHSQLLAVAKLLEVLDSPLHKYLKQADCLNYFFCFCWILIQFKRSISFSIY